MNDFALVHRTAPARSGEGPHPGVLLLHGRGADEFDLLPLASELDARLFTITARAPFPFPGSGHMWYGLDPRGVGFPEVSSLNLSIERLTLFVDQIIERYPIDASRLYVSGFSMGAAMAATLALLLPEKIAGAAILSGYLPLDAGLVFRTQETENHPIFQAHGALDTVIPVQWGRQTRDYLLDTPVDLQYHEYRLGHEISMQELHDLASWFRSILDMFEL